MAAAMSKRLLRLYIRCARIESAEYRLCGKKKTPQLALWGQNKEPEKWKLVDLIIVSKIPIVNSFFGQRSYHYGW